MCASPRARTRQRDKVAEVCPQRWSWRPRLARRLRGKFPYARPGSGLAGGSHRGARELDRGQLLRDRKSRHLLGAPRRRRLHGRRRILQVQDLQGSRDGNHVRRADAVDHAGAGAQRPAGGPGLLLIMPKELNMRVFITKQFTNLEGLWYGNKSSLQAANAAAAQQDGRVPAAGPAGRLDRSAQALRQRHGAGSGAPL